MGSQAATSYQDETIQCCSCHSTFVFTAREQELYERKGYEHKPKRCARCRHERKVNRQNGNRRNTKSVPSNTVYTKMSDGEMLLEQSKALGELRVLIDREFKALNKRLDGIEEGLFED